MPSKKRAYCIRLSKAAEQRFDALLAHFGCSAPVLVERWVHAETMRLRDKKK